MQRIARHHIHNAKYLERGQVYWAMSFKSFAVSIVGVFVPAFLYNLGYSVQSILIYFLIRELTELIFVYPTTSLMAKIGIKKTFTLGCLLNLVNLSLLYYLPAHSNLFTLAAITEAISISFFFLPFHFIFSSSVTKKDSGTQIGLMNIIVCVVTALGPLIGGVIATNSSSLKNSILVALFFIIVAVIPLLKHMDKELIEPLSYKIKLRSLINKDLLSNIGLGISESVIGIIWPLFIFLILNSYETLGVIVSASLILVIALDYVSGRYTDRGKTKQMLKIGSFGSSLIHLLHIAVSSTPAVAVINLTSEATNTAVRIPWMSEFYKHACKEDRRAYIASMEFAVCLGRALLWVAVISASFALKDKQLFYVAFSIAALSALLVPKITQRN